MKQDFAQFTVKPASQLPEPLPAGERLVWQGRPAFAGLAWRAFHIREVVVYFGLLMAWRLWRNGADGLTSQGLAFDASMTAVATLLLPAVAAVAVLLLLAWLFRRATTYTITNRRVLLQFGVALPMTMNIPLDTIAGAALKTYRNGSGDIPLVLSDDKASFVLMWPHVRPWRLRAAEPMMRAIPDAAIVATKLNDALSGLPGPAASSIEPSKVAAVSTGGMPAAAAAAA